MLIKKEFNQKKMELDVIQREYREIREKIKNSQQIKEGSTTTTAQVIYDLVRKLPSGSEIY